MKQVNIVDITQSDVSTRFDVLDHAALTHAYLEPLKNKVWGKCLIFMTMPYMDRIDEAQTRMNKKMSFLIKRVEFHEIILTRCALQTFKSSKNPSIFKPSIHIS